MLKSKKWVITSRLVFILLLALVIFFNPKTAMASSCSSYALTHSKSSNFPYDVSCASIPTNATVTVNAGGPNKFIPNETYTLWRAKKAQSSQGQSVQVASSQATNENSITFTLSDPVAFEPGTWFLSIFGPSLGDIGVGCGLSGFSPTYKVGLRSWSAEIFASQTRGGKMCYGFPTGCLEAGTPITLTVENVKLCGKPYANKRIDFSSEGNNVSRNTDTNGNLTGQPIVFTFQNAGNYGFVVGPFEYKFDTILRSKFTIRSSGQCDTCLTTKPKPIDPNQPYQYKICDQINGDLMSPEGGSAKDACLQCVGGNELGREGIWTAIGCIPRDPEKIVKSLLRLGLGMGGGFALIIILASGFVLSVSQGEPNRINEAKQWLTSALVGMLFIIFSVTLLHFIGYTIFRIPGFGGP